MNAPSLFRHFVGVAGLSLTLWLSGCGTIGPSVPAGAVPGQISSAVPDRGRSPEPTPRASNAVTPRDYRRDAAQHIYGHHKDRIFHGMLPPMLYAVGTLEVHLDSTGRIVSMHWLRAPQHAPEVIAEIERIVLNASPFPAATRIGKVTWTDTWLWDRSDHFQLDTLTEGQLQQ